MMGVDAAIRRDPRAGLATAATAEEQRVALGLTLEEILDRLVQRGRGLAQRQWGREGMHARSEEHTSELQSH